MKILAQNRKAFHNYNILKTLKAGISLRGHEVKAVKSGRINIQGSYAVLKNKEVFLVGATIPPYQPKNTPPDYNPQRDRKLLLKKSEIKEFIGQKKQKGLTLVPLKVYTIRGLVKIEIGLAKGKKKFDKRQAIKKRDALRSIKRALTKKQGDDML